MGTREVYEEKLRSGNLHHDPTINPGLGSSRCPRCLSLLNPNSENGEWTITSVLHDATAVAGSGAGGMLSAVNGFNTGIPFVQKRVKGPKWLPFVIGLPPLLLFSAASAAFGGSVISFFKNGVCQGVAFKDLYGGRYYPAASMYTLPNQPNCTVKFNFGPDFEYFPQDFDERPIPKPMIEVPYHGFDGKVENGETDEKEE